MTPPVPRPPRPLICSQGGIPYNHEVIDELRAQVATLQRDARRYADDLTAAHRAMATLTQQRDAERTRYVLANAGWAEMDRQNEALTQQLREALVGVDNREVALDTLRSELGAARREVAKMQAILKQQEERNERLMTTIRELESLTREPNKGNYLGRLIEAALLGTCMAYECTLPWLNVYHHYPSGGIGRCLRVEDEVRYCRRHSLAFWRLCNGC